MGHLNHTEKRDLVPLIRRLQMNPVGAPETEDLYEILSILYTPEEAEVASRFPLLECTFDELLKVTGRPSQELPAILNSMCEKGLIMETPVSGQTYYLLTPLLIGLFEFTFMKTWKHYSMKRLAELLETYEKGAMGAEFLGSATRMARTAAYENAIPQETRILTYEKASELIEESSYGALQLCYCRHRAYHLEKACSVPMEDLCTSFGEGARFLVRRGFAREAGKEDLMAALERAEEFGLVHVLDNVQKDPSFLCHCCSCCCTLFSMLESHKVPHGIAPSNFTASAEEKSCTGCGACERKCPLHIPQIQSRKARVNPALCLGCGVCVKFCNSGAMKLHPRGKKIHPPRTKQEKLLRIAREKGRLLPFAKEGLRKRLFKSFPL
jgi:ferredoxin